MSRVLVINTGSSSLKYQLIDMTTERMLASGLVDRIGEAISVARHTAAVPEEGALAPASKGTSTRELAVPDHTAAFAVML